MATIDDIKRLTLKALMADDILMQGLVLKGGNALQLAYDITNRGSIDIDFSMEKEFSEKDFERLRNQFERLLNDEFNTQNLVVYDTKFIEKPKQGSIPEWKGYLLEFKVIEKHKYDLYKDHNTQLRNNSIKVNGQSPKYTVDISSYEYISGAKSIDIEGLILKVYTPEMILIEKIRALCQSMEDYKTIVTTARSKKRARDFYDIWMITKSFQKLDLTKDLFENIFAAKRVPLEFLNQLEELREPNRENWETVKQTINTEEELMDYDHYFNHMLEIVTPFITHVDNKSAT